MKSKKRLSSCVVVPSDDTEGREVDCCCCCCCDGGEESSFVALSATAWLSLTPSMSAIFLAPPRAGEGADEDATDGGSGDTVSFEDICVCVCERELMRDT